LESFAKKSSIDLINLCIYWCLIQEGVNIIIIVIRGIEQLLNIVNIMETQPSNNILNDFNNILIKYKFNNMTGLGAFVKL
jgi:aryl-alcohol dehydrogenase-like predicted oxidoreductase